MTLFQVVILLNIVRCVTSSSFIVTGQGLTAVPTGIPSSTDEINLSNNLITEVDPTSLSHLSLLDCLDVNTNQLTEFPDVCSVGSTLLVLRLSKNPITVIETARVSCLTKLQHLYLDYIEVSQFPDLSSVGNTLSVLYFSSKNTESITASDLQFLDILQYLQIEGAKLSNFPDVRPIGDTLLTLRLQGNNLATIPQDIAESLVKIKIFSISANNFSVNPDICCMNETLLELNLMYNPLNHIVADTFYCLTKLKVLRIGGKQLSTIGNLDLEFLKNSLKLFKIEQSSLTSLPDMQNMLYIENLHLNNNPLLSEFPEDLFDGWVSLVELKLNDNSINMLPNFKPLSNSLQTINFKSSQIHQLNPGNIGVLRNLVDYILTDTQFVIPFIPPPCSFNPGNLNVEIEGVNVDLCACRHVWIKVAEELGANVKMDSTQCFGTEWSNVSSRFLYDLCDASLLDIQSAKAIRKAKSFYCAFPVKQTISAIKLTECLRVCLSIKGCYSFNFKTLSITNYVKEGDCAIIAPKQSGTGLQTGISDTGWDYYELSSNDLI